MILPRVNKTDVETLRAFFCIRRFFPNRHTCGDDRVTLGWFDVTPEIRQDRTGGRCTSRVSARKRGRF
jgi:hypothetical protein